LLKAVNDGAVRMSGGKLFHAVGPATQKCPVEWPICTLLLQKDASFGAHHKTLNEDRPTLSATKM